MQGQSLWPIQPGFGVQSGVKIRIHTVQAWVTPLGDMVLPDPFISPIRGKVINWGLCCSPGPFTCSLKNFELDRWVPPILFG